MKQIIKASTMIALAVAATIANAAGLSGVVQGSIGILTESIKMLNVIAALIGGWFVISGIMNWKKSSNEHGGQSIEFKSVITPIIAGVLLVSFTTLIMLTSTTFGFATSNPTSF